MERKTPRPKLNDQQEKAANHKWGACFVSACPGSGKTRVITERAARLIEGGFSPTKLLCITFTNKAAQEMKQRLTGILGETADQIYVSTFHALSLNILRKFGKSIGYTSNITVLDDDDQIALMSQCARQMGYDLKKPEVKSLVYTCGDARENLYTDAQFDAAFKSAEDAKIAREYVARMLANNQTDFSGILSETIRLLEKDKQVCQRLMRRFDLLQVDEAQDCNKAQHKITKLIGAHGNIFMVGDLDQCFVKGTKVRTPQGNKNIEDLQLGDEVISAHYKDSTKSFIIENIHVKDVISSQLININCGSDSICCTPEHIVFADYTDLSPDLWIVYLMKNNQNHFRIGITRTQRLSSKKGHRRGYEARLHSQGGESMWFIKTCNTKREALYWELYYSAKHGIPSAAFVAHKPTKNSLTQDEINNLFSSLETESNAKRLMKEENLYSDFPHHIIKSHRSSDSIRFVVTLCAGNSGFHTYFCYFSDEKLAKKMTDMGLKISQKINGSTFRLSGGSVDLSKVFKVFDSLEKMTKVTLVRRFRFAGQTLQWMPASHVRKGMQMLSIHGEQVSATEVSETSNLSYSGKVYDINVPPVHNYIANNIFVHNCIYGWRGADPDSVSEFMNDPATTVIDLPINYRSTPEIVSAASKLIRANQGREKANIQTINASGSPIKCFSAQTPDHEASMIAATVEKLVHTQGYKHDQFAVLYRANAMSRALETAFMNRGVPYQVIGGFSFFKREEIKDALAMLRFYINPFDSTALARFVNKPSHSIGEVTLGKIENYANQNKVDLISALMDVDKYLKATAKAEKVKNRAKLIGRVFSKDRSGQDIGSILEGIVKDLSYEDWIEVNYEDDADDRKDSLSELINAAARASKGSNANISEYLNKIALMTTADKSTQAGTVSLMTIHASKGLEFPVVFLPRLEEGKMPHNRSSTEDRGVEEERRLCYVAMTRAEKVLIASYSKQEKIKSGKFLRTVNNRPSRFLFESGILKKDDEDVW